MTIHLGSVEIKEDAEPDKTAMDDRKKTVLMDGVTSGDRLTFESALAGYMVKLENSKMFGRPEIVKQSSETTGDEEILKFTARVEII